MRLAWAFACLALLFTMAIAAVGLAKVDAPVSDLPEMKVFFQVQFWNVIAFDFVNSAGQKVDTRNDLTIRRGRVGIQGKFRQDVTYKLCLAYDNVGKSSYNGATGTAQDSDNGEFYLWDTVATWHLDRTWVNLSLGYFRPQVGRECITSSFNVNSLTKSLANSYPREHLVGRSTGRETGLNLGGFSYTGAWGLSYNLGFFDTNHQKITGSENGGVNWAPLFACRVAVTYGDPEMKAHGLGYRTNYASQRKGMTLAINATHQGQTDQTLDADSESYRGGFLRNELLGFDLLANYGPLNLSAEYDLLRREFCRGFATSSSELVDTEYEDSVWHVRVGYNLLLGKGQLLEPSLMLSKFEGDAHSALYPGGIHEVVQWSLNWYRDGNDWKLNLSYTDQDGEAVSGYTDGIGQKGDFVALGLQLKI